MCRLGQYLAGGVQRRFGLYVYGCQRTDLFAGLAMASGLAPPICPADAGISLQISHGTADVIVPFDGGPQAVGDGAVDLDSVPKSAAGWAATAGCDPEPNVEVFGDTNASTATVWTGCAGEAQVSLLAVDGLNHLWPGMQSPSFLTPISPIVDAGCVVVATMTGSSEHPFADCFGP